MAKEFNTIAVDGGIAMGGHDGMLYSLGAGLSLPGNGSTLATHAYRRHLFLDAGPD